MPDWLIAILLETYYAGRCECHIRRLPICGMLLDFLSEYPTSFVLQSLHPYLVAQGFDCHDIDVADLRSWITSLTLGDLFNHQTWKRLAVVVLVAPDRDLLPTRCNFKQPTATNDTTRDASATWTLGIQRRTSGPAQWYTLADVLASWLETGRTPTIAQALAFTPRGLQPGTQPINLAGDPRFRIDPEHDDIVRQSVELRATIRHEADNVTDHGAAELLSATAGGLKISTNTIYGDSVELNVDKRSKPTAVTVHHPDGRTTVVDLTHVQEPGQYFHPLLATLIPAGGRLLLALVMRLVADTGDTYVMCDTDSLFVAATLNGTPGPRAPDIPYLSIGHVLEHVVKPFEQLNRYDPSIIPCSILQVKPVNLDPDTGEHRVVYCHAIASKRYCLYTLDDNGWPHICVSEEGTHRSAHGLGHVLPPLGIDDDTDWITQVWEHLVARDLGLNPPEPEWFDQPTFGRIGITTTHDDELFEALNAGKPYRQQIRPFGFATVAYRHHHERQQHPDDGLLITAFTRDLSTAMRALFMFRNAPERGNFHIRTGYPEYVIPGTVSVQTFRDLIAEYAEHPERKALGLDGQPCKPSTRGTLQPRHIEATKQEPIGKEANRLTDGDPLTQAADHAVEYGQRLGRCGHPLSGRQRDWCSEGCRKRGERLRLAN
jgi:hypothetical protein